MFPSEVISLSNTASIYAGIIAVVYGVEMGLTHISYTPMCHFYILHLIFNVMILNSHYFVHLFGKF